MERSDILQNHAEDRLFSTAVSVNTLINIWTTLNNGTLHWDTGMCQNVLCDALHREKGVCYVNRYA